VRRLVWVGLAVALFASLLPASAIANAPVGSSSNPLVLGTVRFFGFLPSYAIPRLLKRQGIFVKLVEFPSATERLEAVAAGNAQMSYAGLTASILLRARGTPMVVVASTDEKGRALVVKPGIKSIAELRGKEIGVTFGSIEQMTLIAELQKAGLDYRHDVKLVNIPATDQPLVFSKGGVAAYMGFEPWPTFGVKKFGGKILLHPYDTPLGGIDSGIETTEAFARQYPRLVTAVVKAHIQMVNYYRSHPSAVVQAGVEAYKVPEDVMAQALKNVDLTYNLHPEQMHALGQFMVTMGFLKEQELRSIDWGKFVNTSFLKAAEK
jgi:ABC-type nitrate/sulfonate/bicarbonate transport system substrate-binding protein